MHLGKKYTFPSYLVWTRWEIGYLFVWSLFVTSLFELLHWTFLEMPAPLLEVVGIALAIILGFKNQECFNRVREAQVIWEQIDSASIVMANKLASTPGIPNTAEAPALRGFFYRHFAWLTVLRFNLRETKSWENIHEPGNKKFLAALPTPESRSVLNDELAAYLPDDELQRRIAATRRPTFLKRNFARSVACLPTRSFPSTCLSI